MSRAGKRGRTMRALLTIMGGALLSEVAVWHFAEIGCCGPANWAGVVLFAAMTPMDALPRPLQTSAMVASVIFAVFACVWAVPVFALLAVRHALTRSLPAE